MQDTFSRSIRYLRLSLTSACQMRCTYCRPDWLRHCDQSGQLTADEIESVVRHLVARHGIHKVRLTGGDPTARPDLIPIIRRVAAIDGVRDLAMTTNGLTLARLALDYRMAGVRRVNVSLDSLDGDTFARMTGVNGLERVLAGIDAAIAAGLAPIRLNCVVLAGDNDRQLPDLVRFAAARKLEIRFIELMPMGPLAEQWSKRYVPAAVMRERLNPHVADWQPIDQGHESAQRFDLRLTDGRRVTVGFITPMSCNFCAACNRLRLTADGHSYPCLMDQPRGSFLPAVRPHFDAAHFDRLLSAALGAKASEHPAQGVAVMTTIGG
ncbi:MAG: GTP 3',8-cyclase MoaA [Phycisphaeraceae bacterium]|nr:GTP 3',8-cyclase MoaA [Phycisphaeraceae bacterium]